VTQSKATTVIKPKEESSLTSPSLEEFEKGYQQLLREKDAAIDDLHK
jgi:hypothetical protein